MDDYFDKQLGALLSLFPESDSRSADGNYRHLGARPGMVGPGSGLEQRRFDVLDDIDGFFDGERGKYVSKFLGFTTSLTKAAGTRAARVAADLLNVKAQVFDINRKSVRDFIADDLARRSKLINASTARIIKADLVEAVNSQQSIFEIRDRLTDRYRQFTESRAENIARTEVVRASSAAEVEAYRQMGVEYKEWIAESDDRVRDSHADVDGKVVGIDEMFVVGSSVMYAPGMGDDPAEVCNCRCAVAPVASED